MKKALLTAAALTLVSGAAFASKARVNALGGAAHLVDAQGIYTDVSQMHATGDFVSIEMGTAGATPNAEGMFVKTMGDYKLGVSVGHNEGFTQDAMTTLGFAGMQNPFAVAYGAKSGDMNWAAALGYSNVDGKDSDLKASGMKTYLGASTEAWTAYAQIGLGASASGNLTGGTDANSDGDFNDAGDTAQTLNPDAKYKGTSGILLGGTMISGSITYFAEYGMDGYKYEDGAVDHELSGTAMKFGMVNSHKADGVDFFYGLSYEMVEKKATADSPAILTALGLDEKETVTTLPLLVGMEAEAASFLTLRGSIKQNLPFITETKTTTAAGNAGSSGNLGNSTVVAAGAGLKFGKATLDMSLDMGTTGVVSAAPIGGNAALTYLF